MSRAFEKAPQRREKAFSSRDLPSSSFSRSTKPGYNLSPATAREVIILGASQRVPAPRRRPRRAEDSTAQSANVRYLLHFTSLMPYCGQRTPTAARSRGPDFNGRRGYKRGMSALRGVALRGVRAVQACGVRVKVCRVSSSSTHRRRTTAAASRMKEARPALPSPQRPSHSQTRRPSFGSHRHHSPCSRAPPPRRHAAVHAAS